MRKALNMMVQREAAERAMAEAHDKMIAEGWEWDGMDGYTHPGTVTGRLAQPGADPFAMPKMEPVSSPGWGDPHVAMVASMDLGRAEERMAALVEQDPVWRALRRLRGRAATPEEKGVRKSQQMAYGYGATLRQLHEMARLSRDPQWGGKWSSYFAALTFSNAYGGSQQRYRK